MHLSFVNSLEKIGGKISRDASGIVIGHALVYSAVHCSSLLGTVAIPLG